MKHILIIILSLLMVSCEDKKSTSGPINIEDTSFGTEHYVYDSCEYVAFAAGRYRWGSHKGNCNNPIHQYKQIDLSVLDSIDYILDWYVQDGVLKVITTKDEINDELQRLKYIQKTFYE